MLWHLLVLIIKQLNKHGKINCLSKIHEPGGGVNRVAVFSLNGNFSNDRTRFGITVHSIQLFDVDWDYARIVG